MRPPPPNFLYPTSEALLEAIGEACSPEQHNLACKLAQRGLPPVTSIESLSVTTGFSRRFLLSMAMRQHKYYREFYIRKGGKNRPIHAPRVALKLVQKWFGDGLARGVVLSDIAHGFVPGRSVFTAAHAHLGARWAVSVDLEQFFPSVKLHHVVMSLHSLGYPPEAIRLLAQLVTRHMALPQGSPASPILANLACAELDAQLAAFAAEKGVRLTRYADDIVCTGVEDCDPQQVCERLKEIVGECGWTVNESKTRVDIDASQTQVLGLLVHQAALRLPKAARNRCRRIRWDLRKISSVSNLTSCDRGFLAYADSLDRFNRAAAASDG